MSKYLSRLLLAFCISASFFFATEDWYKRTKSRRVNHTGQERIAQLQDLKNEVQRKPMSRVIWETISKDEDLYAGEAIRTASNADAKILFIKTGTLIELEPDSLVVLEETDKGLSLDFLKGNMFVKSTGSQTGKESLTLKSGGSEINLQNADISLSKGNNDQVDIQVFGGKAQIKQGNKTLSLDESQSGSLNKGGLDVGKNQIQITSPLAGDHLYIDPKKREKISFYWEKLSADYKIYVERGTSRQNMVRDLSESSLGNSGSVQITSKLGRYFWRLVGEPITPGRPVLKSAIIPFAVVAKQPPVPLEPFQKSQVVIEKANPMVKFKWANPAKLEQLIIEIAKDPLLKEQIVKESIENKNGVAEFKIPVAGDYFWRVTGFMNLKNKMIPAASEVFSFHVKIGAELIPPVLRSPSNNQSLPFNQVMEKGVLLSWDLIPGIFNYEVVIEKEIGNPRKLASTGEKSDGKSQSGLQYETILTQELKSSPARANDLKPGNYRWTARSIDSEGAKSVQAPFHYFSINDMPQIEWARGSGPEEYQYYTARPSLILQWLKGTTGTVASWQYRLSDAEEKLNLSSWVPTQNPEIRKYLDKDGTFFVEVEALNSHGQSVAKSSKKNVKVTPKPLLPGPQFASELPEILKASRKGDLSLKWDPVQGAQKYQLNLKNVNGKTIKKEIVESTGSELNRLQPGQYEVSVQSLDEHDRPGPPGSTKKIEVPRVSNIAAPKIKGIQVK